MRLAREIVSIFHGDEAAMQAEEHFKTVFQQHELPPDMPEYPVSGPISLPDLMVAAGAAPSKREARRLIEQGGVKLDGQEIKSIEAIVTPGQAQVLQVGRRRFVKLT
jgi:tyrosyl-tRNA synthetase